MSLIKISFSEYRKSIDLIGEISDLNWLWALIKEI